MFFVAVCPVGTFGEGCQELCECVGGETCDPATGKCDCSEGRKGFQCEDGKDTKYNGYILNVSGRSTTMQHIIIVNRGDGLEIHYNNNITHYLC